MQKGYLLEGSLFTLSEAGLGAKNVRDWPTPAS